MSYIKLTKNELDEIKRLEYIKGSEAGKAHAVSAPETIKRFRSMEQNIDLIVEMIKQLDSKQEKRMNDFCAKNDSQHGEIIKRQDHTNGSIAKLKRNQIYLRGALVGAILILMAFGFMPERLWLIIKSLFLQL